MFVLSILIAETLTFFSLDTFKERKLSLFCLKWIVAKKRASTSKICRNVYLKKKKRKKELHLNLRFILYSWDHTSTIIICTVRFTPYKIYTLVFKSIHSRCATSFRLPVFPHVDLICIGKTNRKFKYSGRLVLVEMHCVLHFFSLLAKSIFLWLYLQTFKLRT